MRKYSFSAYREKAVGASFGREGVFQSGMAGDESDGLWTLCHNQVSLCKLGGTVMTSSHTGWKSFFMF